MSFDKVMECVEDLKEKFAAEVRIQTAPLIQGLLAFQPELSVICDAELSVAQRSSSRHHLPLCTGLVGGFGRFVDCGVSALLNPPWTSSKC